MKSITKQKPFDEIKEQLADLDRLFIIGCGTCTTMTHTGGVDEVLEMRDRLQELGKRVSGWMDDASCILAMPCALGVQRISSYINKPVIPALDTLFIGLEETPGNFHEVCAQCGQCIIGETAGICPIATCHKGLVNGPCGGTNNGKCEVDPEKDCAWTLIYERLKAQGRLDLMKKYHPPHNFQVVPRPRTVRVE
jgi:hypothetical protein